MPRNVKFSGHISQAAAGDFYYFGDSPHSVHEWALQKDFQKATGITCGRDAREWLTDLMQVHGFTGRELGNAWRFGSLGWDKRTNEPRVKISRAEPYFAWFCIAIVTLYFAAVASVFVIGSASDHKFAVPILNATGLMYLGVIVLLRKALMDPRAVALRIKGAVAVTANDSLQDVEKGNL